MSLVASVSQPFISPQLLRGSGVLHGRAVAGDGAGNLPKHTKATGGSTKANQAQGLGPNPMLLLPCRLPRSQSFVLSVWEREGSKDTIAVIILDNP